MTRTSQKRMQLISALGGTLVLAVVLAVQAQAGLYDKGGANGLGARAMGMAGAYSAVADDEDAVLWNPAGLGEVNTLCMDSSFGTLYDGRTLQTTFSAAYPLPDGAGAGLAWEHAFYPQAVQINADTLGLAGSLPLTDDQRLHLGAALKMLFGGVRVQGGDYLGMGMDLGLRYKYPLANKGEALVFGFRIQDPDTRIQYGNGTSEQVPQSLALGAAYHLDAATMAALDLEMIHSTQLVYGETRVLRVGLERWFREMFGVRAGYLVDNQRTNTFSAGLGFKYSGWELEYGLVGGIADLGFSHRLSISYGLSPLRVLRSTAPSATHSQPVMAQTAQPYQMELTADPVIFSPNGDGVADTTTFNLALLKGEQSRLAAWRLTIENLQGTIVNYFDGPGFPERMSWDGEDHDGKLCPDGLYLARLLLVDAQDKRMAHAETQVVLQTHLTHVALEADRSEIILIAGVAERDMNFTPRGGEALRGLTWKLEVINDEETTVRTFAGENQLPLSISWNGWNDQGKPVPEGTYEVRLLVRNTAGNQSKESVFIQVTRLAAKVDYDVTPKLFKPGDPKDGKVVFHLDVLPDFKVQEWKLTIREAPSGRQVDLLTGLGNPGSKVIWDGKTSKGNLVRGGLYFQTYFQVTFPGKGVVEGPVRAIASDLTTQAQDSGRGLALNLTAISFEPGSSVIPLEAFKNLQQAVDSIKRYAKLYRVQVKGYTDTQEAKGHEIALSRQRAQRVADYLITSGKIPADAIEVIENGAGNPLMPETTASGQEKNRRVEVVLIIQK